MRFHATVELGGKTATGVELPAEVVAALGPTMRPPDRVTINGYTHRSSVASMGGRFLLGVSADVREKAGVQAGDEVGPRKRSGVKGSALSLDRLGAELVTKQGQRGLFGVHRFRHVGWVDRLADLVTGRRVKW